MRPRPAKSFNHLAELCSLHHQLELFLWLQSKVSKGLIIESRNAVYHGMIISVHYSVFFDACINLH